MNKLIQKMNSEYDTLIKRHTAELETLTSEKAKADDENHKAEAKADAAMVSGNLSEYDKASASAEKALRTVRFYEGRMEAVKAEHSSELKKFADKALNDLQAEAATNYAALRTSLIEDAHKIVRQIDDLENERAEINNTIRKVMTAAGASPKDIDLKLLPKISQGIGGKRAVRDAHKAMNLIEAIANGEGVPGFSADQIKNWL